MSEGSIHPIGPDAGHRTRRGVPPARSVVEVLSVLCTVPADPDGEAEFLLEHALQCAALLYAERPDDLELQVAGLLHDVGHLFTPGHPDLHGFAGSEFLAPLFGARIATLVEMHVDAKRYLVATFPGYRSSLSPESTATLVAQGESMNADEVEAFDRHPLAPDAIALRKADDAAKVWGKPVPGIERWIPVLELLAHTAPA
jgi:predicted HD phosphohydrolase